MLITNFRPFASPAFAVLGITPSCGVGYRPPPLLAVSGSNLLNTILVQYRDSDSMTVRVLFILPPVRMRFVNHNLSVFIPDKLPVLDFFISPGMIRIEWTHSQKQVYMRVSVSLVVNTPISAHSHIHKGFLDIVCRIGYLFLTAPFPWQGKFKGTSELCVGAFLYFQNFIPQALFLKSDFKLCQSCFFIRRSLVTDRFLKVSYIFLWDVHPFRRGVFTQHQAGIYHFLLGSVVADPPGLFVLHYVTIQISRSGYDRLALAASHNLYCIVKYRYRMFPPFCRIRHSLIRLKAPPTKRARPAKRRPAATCGRLIRTTSGCP